MLAPLDYTRPDGSALTLALRRYRAEEEPRLGTLFVNPGGPGLSGMEMAGALKKEGLRQFDVVGWDPRGVGASTPVRCDPASFTAFVRADGSPDSPAEEAALIRSARKFGASCLARSGALLEHVSTEETVRDLDLLRHMLGDPQLTYYGESYGSAIGSLYATMYPQQVGKLAFDGAYNFDDPPVRGTTYAFERQLTALVDFCLQGTSCSLGDHRDVALRRIDELLRSLDQAPMPAGDRKLTQGDAVRALGFGLYEPQFNWDRLTRALASSIEQRDGAQLLALADQYTGLNPDGSYPHWWTAYFAVTCLDERAAGLDERLADSAGEARTAPILGPHLGLAIACPLWPVRNHPRPPIGASTKPILIVSTTGDPAASYESATRLTQRLKNSVLLTMQGHGHGAYRHSNCIQNHVVTFLIHGSTPAPRTSCDI